MERSKREREGQRGIFTFWVKIVGDDKKFNVFISFPSELLSWIIISTFTEQQHWCFGYSEWIRHGMVGDIPIIYLESKILWFYTQGETVPFKPFTNRYHTPYKASNSTAPFWYSIKRGSAYIIVLSSYSAYGMRPCFHLICFFILFQHVWVIVSPQISLEERTSFCASTSCKVYIFT